MLLWMLVAAFLLAFLGIRIAASPLLQLIALLFAGWADRCLHGPELS